MSMYGKKPLQYCKVISLQLVKINEKKKNRIQGKLDEEQQPKFSLGRNK